MSFGFYLTGVRAGGAGFETHLSDSTNVFRSAARNLIGDYARMGDLFNRNQMMRRNANDFTNLNMNIRRQLGALADRIRLMDSTEMEESIRTLRRELIGERFPARRSKSRRKLLLGSDTAQEWPTRSFFIRDP